MKKSYYENIKNRLKWYKVTPFQEKVLLATLEIPRGRTLSYKVLAEKIGHPKAFRAVGTALKKNPLPLIIPCHRVIRSDGDIGRYSNGGTIKKRRLLINENAIK